MKDTIGSLDLLVIGFFIGLITGVALVWAVEAISKRQD